MARSVTIVGWATETQGDGVHDGRMDVDLVVYGATSSGVAASTAAARLGMRVVLADAGGHIGGMLTGGLARSDVERQERLIGGLAREFFTEVRRRGDDTSPDEDGLAWRFEPRHAAAVLARWMADADVVVRTGWSLAAVQMSDGRITALVADDGSELGAPLFVDATYEGDLLAAAGVSYAIGREGRDRYGEALAGRLEMLPNPHQFAVPVPARTPTGELLPHVQPYDNLGPLGHGDGKVQAYCYRLCLTDDPDAGRPITAPVGYDPDDYVLVRRFIDALRDALGGDAALVPRRFFGLGRLPNGKLDINSDGPVSTNLLGASWEYPEADGARRAEIADAHLRWAQGLLYFLGNDASVPADLRRQMARLGLPADEFAANGGWPPQLYVREARRMMGAHVLTERDVRTPGRDTATDAIGWGGYNIDIREVQWVAAPVSRFPDVTDEVLTEGYLSVPVDPYPIPYRTLLPRREQCRNLLVPTCMSASHVAFASLRMEPQYLIAGQAAGTAAALSADSGRDLHDVDTDRLRHLLRSGGQVVDPPA